MPVLATSSLAFHCAELGPEQWFGRNCLAEEASAIKAKPSPLPAAFQQELLWAVRPRDTRIRRISSFILSQIWKTSVSKAHTLCQTAS